MDPEVVTRSRRVGAGWLVMQLATCLMVALLAGPNPAAALELTQEKNADVNGRIAGGVPRIYLDVVPGHPAKLQFWARNNTGKRAKLRFSVRDLDTAKDPQQAVTIVDNAPYGARKWITPEVRSVELEQGQRALVDATVRAPLDAAAGSYYAAIVIASDRPGTGDPAGGAQVSQVRSVALQVLLDVPGDEVRAGTLTSVDLPHLLWRDEGSFAPITIEWENTGTTTDTITGSIRMKSLFGNTARKLQMHEMVVLRGGTRTQRVLWHDPPWIGRFTPEVTAIGVAGERMTLRGHAIWIVPPWQYVLATVIAAIGGWVWYRRRQRQAAAGLEDEREP